MKQIFLTNGITTIVSGKDYPALSKHRWHLHSQGYASTNINGRLVLMHRLIMGTPRGMDTDHINGDKLDNRRTNLRVCTHAQNQLNRKAPRPYKNRVTESGGLYWNRRTQSWNVRLQRNKIRRSYGYYKKLEDATRILLLARGSI